MTELLLNNQRTIVQREANYGVDQIAISLAADSAVRYEAFTDVSVTLNGEQIERAIRRVSFSSNRGKWIKGNLGWTINGIIPFPAVAGNAPLGLDNLLVLSGMVETLVANTTATYVPQTTAQAGGTAYHYLRHADVYTFNLIYGTGIRGNMVIAGEVGQFATFAFTGESNNFPDDSTVTSSPFGWTQDLAFFAADGTINLDKNGVDPTYAGTETTDDPGGMCLQGATLTVNTVDIPISAISIDHGNVINPKRIASPASTVNQVVLVGRGVKITATLESTGAAFEAELALLRSGAEVALSAVLTDNLGSGGTTLTVSCQTVQVEQPPQGPNDSNGLANWQLLFGANGAHASGGGLGDNEISYVWSVTP